jgi:hypothetical protein
MRKKNLGIMPILSSVVTNKMAVRNRKSGKYPNSFERASEVFWDPVCMFFSISAFNFLATSMSVSVGEK